MAVKDKSPEAAPADGKRTGKENIRWGIGLTLLAAGFYTLLAILFYYATWRDDYAILHPGFSDYEGGRTISNACGSCGAYIADAVVGQAFGVFGILVPVMGMLIGVRIIRRRPRFINRLLLCCMLVLIFGSLTLGFAFGDKWGVFGSGWGGAFGVFVIQKIGGVIGPVGNIIFLVVGWIFTGVLINTNFINTVNTAGTAVVDRGEAIWDSVLHSAPGLFRRRKKRQDFDEFLRESEELRPEAPESEEDIFDDEPELPEEEQEPIVVEPQMPEEETAEEIVETEESEETEEPEEENETEEDARQSGLGQIVVEEHREQQVGEHEIGTLYDPMKDLHNYHRPSPELLEEHSSDSHVTDEEITYNKHRIEETLANFGIPIRDMKATVGPTVTLYEIVQEQGVKIAKIRGLENDIAQSLKALGIRIIAPIPGRGTIGIEVPNRDKEIVSMRSAVLSKRFQQFEAELPIVIGRTIQNENYVFDLAKMPHLLVAGATGQGKSVGLNAIITSLLYRKHPAQLKFVLIDPKMVEFSLYARLEKHFLAKMESEEDAIITDPKKAVNTLQALCIEMGNRLELCKKAAAKNIVEYNDKFVNRRLNPANGHAYMPYIVVVIDEFADLIMMAKEVEAPVMRLAQKARAVGIHLIIATQRPDVRVITGGIKANFPSRIAFRVMQMTDSRTIIDQPGANQLIGRGDMLFSKDGVLTRIQCALVETREVEKIVDAIAAQNGYPYAYPLPDYEEAGMGSEQQGGGNDLGGGAAVKYDALFADIARDAVSGGQISTSYIQRNYEVGFNRAGRIMTQLERAGIVGPQVGAKPREIKFYDLPSLEAKLQDLGVS